jgi:hypothetical protein
LVRPISRHRKVGRGGLTRDVRGAEGSHSDPEALFTAYATEVTGVH